jgi:hypothetical protein
MRPKGAANYQLKDGIPFGVAPVKTVAVKRLAEFVRRHTVVIRCFEI